jgi:hypothetical protein
MIDYLSFCEVGVRFDMFEYFQNSIFADFSDCFCCFFGLAGKEADIERLLSFLMSLHVIKDY